MNNLKEKKNKYKNKKHDYLIRYRKEKLCHNQTGFHDESSKMNRDTRYITQYNKVRLQQANSQHQPIWQEIQIPLKSGTNLFSPYYSI